MHPENKRNILVNFVIHPETGDLSCIPTVVHAKENDTIIFFANNRPFTVMCKGLSPLEKVDIRNSRNQNIPDELKKVLPDYSSPKFAVAKVQSTAPNGVYPFACAVYDASSDQVYLDAGCPIIIKDPGTQG